MLVAAGVCSEEWNEADPSTADCSSLSAQIFSKVAESSHNPRQCRHSSIFASPIEATLSEDLQRGHRLPAADNSLLVAAGAPHRGQCLLPMNIIAKHCEQAMVANCASQKMH